MFNPEVKKSLEGIDFSQYAPMGRFSAVARKAMSPQSIRAGAAAFEREASQFQLSQKAQILKEALKRRKLAAEAQAQAQFRKVWPSGSSEQLLKNYIQKKPVFSPRQFFK